MDDFTPDRTDPRLRRALTERLSGPPSGCPDAERLAAWADGALSAAEAAALDAHLADCGRCQSMLAALAATDESVAAAVPAPVAAPPATVVPFRPRPMMKWALPLAAGLAATLVIWTMTRDVTRDQATTPAAESTQAFGPPAAPAPSPGSLAAPAEVRPAAPQPEPRRERDAAKSSADQLADRSAALTRQVPVQQRSVPAAPPAPPPPPAIAATPAPSSTKPAVGADARASTITGLPQSTLNVTIDGVSARGAARQDAIEAVTADSKPIAQFSSIAVAALAERVASNPAVAGGVAGGRAGGGRGGGAAAPVAAQTSLAKQEDATLPAHWRIFVGNRVERSRDSGLTWIPVKLETGLPAITGGAAPSSQVCWLIGARGLVLLSTDNVTFARVTPPADADLTSIRATDALSAVVTTADGRTFTTADGGKRWK